MRSMIEQLYADLQDEKFKIARKAWDVLDREGIADIMTDGKVFWFESYVRGNGCPKYIHEYLKKYIRRKYKLQYLYDVVPTTLREHPGKER